MDYARLAIRISALLSPDKLGMATTLSHVQPTRAATGGAITTTTTAFSVNAAVVSDETTYQDGKPIRTIKAYLTGTKPVVGDLLTLTDGQHRIDAVTAIQPALVPLAYEVTMS